MSQALYPDPPTSPEAAEASRPQPGPGADPGVYPRDLDELHAKLVRWFEECELTTTDGRRLSQRDRDYVSGYQWTSDELAALKLRGQPDVTINYCSRKVQLMCGLERKSRTDPKAFSRNPSDDDKADAATQGLRYIADDNDFPVIRSAVYENLLVEGVGGAELGLEDDGKGGADITITQVPYDRLFWDIHSRRWDFSDARYKGIVIWMDRDQAVEMWPEARDLISDTFSSNAGVYGGYGDRPDAVVWTDSRRERVRVVQVHWDERNVWWTATLTRVGFLAEPMRSPFLDDRGKSASGLVMASAYIDRENNRFGMVRDLISEQDEINKRRSKALHLLSVKQVVLEDGAVTDVDKARREIARPDGMVVVNPGFKFEIADGAQLAEGQFKLLQHATAEMQASGPNASMSGSDPRELSGRAILAQQAGGSAQNEPIADALRLWSRKVYAIAWMAARQYWTAGRWVRITDDLGTTKYVGINQPVRLMDELAAMPEQQRAVAMQRLQIVPGDPRLEQVIRVENDIGGMDIDITIEEGIDVPSIQAEQFQVLIQLAGTQPGLIPPEILIAASNLRNKDQLLQQLKEHQQAAAQQQQVVQKMAQDKAQADITAQQGKAAADFALAKERQHASVHHIADMHQGFVDMSAPPDPPSAPGTVVPPDVQMAMGGPHASGGLVQRVAPPRDFHDRLPPANRFTDPGMVAPFYADQGYPMPGVDQGNLNQSPGIEVLGQFPGTYATGGPIQSTLSPGPSSPVTPMAGPNPAGPDDGFITAKPGEYVLQRSAVARYGQPLIDALNAGLIDPKVLAMAGAHAAADLRSKQAKAAVDEAKLAEGAARTNDIRHQTVQRINDMMIARHNALAPPDGTGGTAGNNGP